MVGAATVGQQAATLRDRVYRDGFVGLPASFARSWAQGLRRDFEVLFGEASAHDGGLVSRGRNRWYLEVHPQRLRGFLDLVTHPLVTSLSEQMLGPDYLVVETGFDVPLPGAVPQPWHRDFPMDDETATEGTLTALAFNVTAADVTREMGPFEVAPGTHTERGEDFAYGMFPPKAHWPRYEAISELRFPQLGDMSARTGLALHRGTANRSSEVRPMMVLGVLAPHVTDDVHALEVTRPFLDALPDSVRRHLHCRVVDELRPITQRHTIEGLVMGG